MGHRKGFDSIKLTSILVIQKHVNTQVKVIIIVKNHFHHFFCWTFVNTDSSLFTTEGRVLFEVLPANVDVLHQTLASVSPPLLYGVLGAQGKHGHVLRRQAEAAQASVELLREALSHLVALVLQPGDQSKACEERLDFAKSRTGAKTLRCDAGGSWCRFLH